MNNKNSLNQKNAIAKVKPLKANIKISEKISVKTSNLYLVHKNKKICERILAKKEINLNNKIDFFISLHLILEISLNAFFRELFTSRRKFIKEMNIFQDIDNISFINKTILFLYSANFDFEDRIGEAIKHYKIIGKLKDFANIRNLLIHGHAIRTITSPKGKSRSSEARKKILNKNISTQVKLFKEICKDMNFFLENLVNEKISKKLIHNYQKQFFNYDFLKK
jgi:hypothetical protein